MHAACYCFRRIRGVSFYLVPFRLTQPQPKKNRCCHARPAYEAFIPVPWVGGLVLSSGARLYPSDLSWIDKLSWTGATPSMYWNPFPSAQGLYNVMVNCFCPSSPSYTSGSEGRFREPPLCVDLDGTLIASDTLADSFCLMVRQNPLTALLALFWLLHGWPRLKDEMMARTRLPVACLPWRFDVLDYLQQERRSGRTLLLVTASGQRIGEEVAVATGLFDEVIGSAQGEGLRGRHKAQYLVQRFGSKGFDYIGDCRADVAVWAQARKGLIVGNRRLVRKARAVTDVKTIFSTPSVKLAAWFEAAGISPWLFLFIPMYFGMEKAGGALVLCIGSVAFNFLDDLMAISSDRMNPARRHRPFASGRLPVLSGVLFCGILLLVAAVIVLQFPWLWRCTFGACAALRLALLFALNR